jgi:hypothetical protein
MTQLGAELQLFIGNYKRTPVGVHRDETNVFHFPIIGRKRMRLWGEEIGRIHPDLRGRLTYDEYLNSSVVAEAEPGGMFYLPSSFWHIGEGDGEYTVSLKLALYSFSDLTVPLATQLPALLVQQGTETGPAKATLPFNLSQLQRIAEETPPPLTLAANAIRQQMSEDAIALYWMKICSGYGFLYPPQPQVEQELEKCDRIKARSQNPTVFRRLSDGRIVVACGGHLIIETDPVCITLLELIRDGEEHEVEALVQDVTTKLRLSSSSDGECSELCFLSRLLRIGAVVRVKPKSRSCRTR